MQMTHSDEEPTFEGMKSCSGKMIQVDTESAMMTYQDKKSLQGMVSQHLSSPDKRKRQDTRTETNCSRGSTTKRDKPQERSNCQDRKMSQGSLSEY